MVRLIAAAPANEGGMQALRAGIEMKLQPGWKTYWRYPGDSGVPPRFDFSGSRNVKDVQVLWPAPARFPDGAGYSIGYPIGVVFPLRILPTQAAEPVNLRLKLDYAVCEKLCVPVDAELELILTPAATSPHEVLLRASEARVPKRASIGADGSLAILAVRQEPGPRPRVVVDVKVPPDTAVDLFAEGPTADWSLPLPEPLAGAPPGMRRFAFELDGLPPAVDAKGARLTFTAVSAAHAIEVAAHLD